MNQKKSIGKEKIKRFKEENRTPIGMYFLMDIGVIVFALAAVYLVSYIRQVSDEELLRNLVMVVVGIGMVGSLLRQGCLENTLDYDNSAHPVRFWCSFLLCLMIAIACIYLPIGGWPYLVVFITLSLFSNGVTGITAAAVLLMITVFLQGADIGVFIMYFISGLLGITMFRKLDHRFKVVIPMLISLMVLVVCETANLILFANQQLEMELFVIPAVNVLVSGILLFGILKLFSTLVIYQYRLKYLELIDPESGLLAEFKEKARQDYFHCMHTAYFCDRIARKLELDVEALKTAGYYHKIDRMLDTPGDIAKRDKLLKPYRLPPKVIRILWEYWYIIIPKETGQFENIQLEAGKKNTENIIIKETAILMFADAIITAILYLQSESKSTEIDYDKIVDMVFRKKLDSGILSNSTISLRELTIIKSIFKEEKLYYDFLR